MAEVKREKALGGPPTPEPDDDDRDYTAAEVYENIRRLVRSYEKKRISMEWTRGAHFVMERADRLIAELRAQEPANG